MQLFVTVAAEKAALRASCARKRAQPARDATKRRPRRRFVHDFRLEKESYFFFLPAATLASTSRLVRMSRSSPSMLISVPPYLE